MLHERDIDAAAQRMSKHRAWALFIARLLPVVRTYVGFVAGILRVPPTTFTLATFAGSFVWCALFVGAGALLGAHWSAIRGPAEVAGIGVAIVLLAALVAVTAAQLRHASA
jgi:membrane protein DedA with SNARE-associated domain